MIATKEQEHAAIAKIRKIVDSLGENSYVGTALEGCLEIADQNIEYDAADSLKRRLDLATEELETAQRKIKTLELDVRDLREAINRDNREASKTITALREKAMSDTELDAVISLVVEKQLALSNEVRNAAERIVEAATEPESAAFQCAVRDHRVAKDDLDRVTALLERLASMRDK